MKYNIINNSNPLNSDFKITLPSLVQIEYRDNGKYKLSQSYGLDIVRQLRLNRKYKQPIVLYSPFTEDHLQLRFRNNQLKLNSLNDPSIALVRQPIDRKKFNRILKKLVSLSDAGLADVNEMLYNKSGYIIDSITHDLKFHVPVTSIKDSISIFFDQNEQDDLDLVSRFGKLLDAQLVNREPIFVAEKLALIQMCSKYFKEGKSSNSKSVVDENESRFTILVLEDDEKFAKKLKSKLVEHFDLEFCSSSKRALKLLEKDVDNKILGVLSDWRLYEKSGEKWQVKQGYDVLSEAAQTGFRAKYALTSLFEENVENIRKKLPIEFELVRKDYLLTESDWNKFISEIYAGCSKALKVISCLPDSADWKAHYRSKYLAKRSSKKWKLYEQVISDESKDILTRIKRVNKNVSIYYNNDLSYTLPNNGSPASSYNLKTILILRRVTLAYWYSLRFKHKSIDRSIKTELRLEVGRKFVGQTASDNSIGKYFKQICIQTNTIESKGTLPEETAWLQKHGLI